MKATHFLCSLVAASIFCGLICSRAATTTQTLTEPTEVQGVPCQGKVELSETGKIKSCTLARDHVVAGYALPTGTAIRFNEAGAVESFVLGQQATIKGFILPAGSMINNDRAFTCTLREKAIIRGVSLPAHSTVFFRTPKIWESEVPNTWDCWLPKDTMIQGHLCGSGEDGCGTIFYASGKLRAVGLAKNEEIDGVPCTSSHNPLRLGMRVLFYGLDVRAWFYENGQLAQGMVSRECIIGGRKFKPGDIVRLAQDGALDPVATTLGALSRNVDKRTPPQSYSPSPGNSSDAGGSDSH